ncbi:MAG: hypothetical protein HRU15_05060, partial [Planctomycetes bacterium]|nr:hypothetical protein [Planctomycetota bacterium]
MDTSENYPTNFKSRLVFAASVLRCKEMNDHTQASAATPSENDNSTAESLAASTIPAKRWLRYFIPLAIFVFISDLWTKAAVFSNVSSSLHP